MPNAKKASYASTTASKSNELVIRHKEFPNMSLTDEELADLLNDELDKSSESVRFEKIVINDGKIKFMCDDKQSYDWLIVKTVESLDKDKKFSTKRAEEESLRFISIKLADPNLSPSALKSRIQKRNSRI